MQTSFGRRLAGALPASGRTRRPHSGPVLGRRWIGALAAAALAGYAAPAGAADGESFLSGDVSIEIQDDWTTQSDDPANERNDLFTKIEAGLAAAITSAFSLKTLLVLEPVLDPGPGEDRFFEDEGLYAEELFAEYDAGGRFAARAGKFGQRFGIAWDVAPGIWGTDFAEDYELAEQIGVAGDVRFGGERLGRHVLTAGTFFADTTFLSDSVLTDRGRTRHEDGGAGNTEDFSSFVVALEGTEMPFAPALLYHVAYAHRGSDAPGQTEETGLVGALTTTFDLGAIGFTPLVEYAWFDDREGIPGAEATYLTTSAEFTYDQWGLAVSRTARDTSAPGTPDADDVLFQVSVGYVFAIGVGVQVGWRHTEEAEVDSETFGFLVDYAFSF